MSELPTDSCKARTTPESLNAAPDKDDALCLLSLYDTLKPKSSDGLSQGELQTAINETKNSPASFAISRIQQHLSEVGHQSGEQKKTVNGTPLLLVIGEVPMFFPTTKTVSEPIYSVSRNDLEKLSTSKP